MIEWCAMISVLVCSKGFVLGGLRGTALIGRVEKKGAFGVGVRGGNYGFP